MRRAGPARRNPRERGDLKTEADRLQDMLRRFNAPDVETAQRAKVLLANGTNGFTPSTWIRGFGAPKWAGVGDFNGDYRADVIWYESNGDRKSVV